MTWILPTRNRRERCQQTLDSIAAHGPSRGVVVMDGCDYGRMDLPEGWEQHRIVNHVELGGVLRWAFQRYPSEEFYGFISDDMVVRTSGWALAMELSAGQWHMASCDDKWKGNSRMAGALCFGGDLMRALGFWVPEGMCHLYVDDVWEHIGRELDCWRYRKDVVVEHLHYANGKGERDDTYLRVIHGRSYAGDDEAIWQRWREHSADDIEMVRAIRNGAIRGPGHQRSEVRQEDGEGVEQHG